MIREAGRNVMMSVWFTDLLFRLKVRHYIAEFQVHKIPTPSFPIGTELSLTDGADADEVLPPTAERGGQGPEVAALLDCRCSIGSDDFGCR